MPAENDLPPQGSVHAPDVTHDELERRPSRLRKPSQPSVDEVLAAGPQPEISKADQIEQLLDESHGRKAPSLEEMRDRARADQAEKSVHKEKPMSPAEAAAALSLMLSARKPAPPEDDWFRIDRLSQELGAPFWVHMRGLTDGEYEQLEQGAYREPTKIEKDSGITTPVQDRAMLNRMVLVRAILQPELTDEELLTKFGPSPLDVVHKWFSPGEIQALAGFVSTMSGFATGAVTRAKE